MTKFISIEILKLIFEEIDELIDNSKDIKPVPFELSKFKYGYENIKRKYIK
jgi:hypothetical protein